VLRKRLGGRLLSASGTKYVIGGSIFGRLILRPEWPMLLEMMPVAPKNCE
jgi:hypothetical protein